MKPIISAHQVSKQYRIGSRQESQTTLREAISGTLRSPLARLRKRRDNILWALRDVSFDVMPGDVLGVIGRNGAGKSTLLKVLSRITEPTAGRIEIYGRIASLLEVGTGFHPELTGRENIYLNGAILGMKRTEIDRKFDEIVAFAEIERFLDTPVKHYSSGMYVRLAFAVAAHLEPDILVIDEVLAVGDAAFQSKCLGKMGEVAKHGRTVVFVSHYMGAVTQLCDKALLLEQGAIVKQGDTERVIECYVNRVSSGGDGAFTADAHTDKDIVIAGVQSLDSDGNPKSFFNHKEPIVIAVTCKINRWLSNSVMGFFVRDHRGRKIFTTKNPEWSQLGQNNKEIQVTATLPLALLVPGKYMFTFAVTLPNTGVVDWVEDVLPITIVDGGSDFYMNEGGDYGCVFAECDWRS
ncbi:MAG: ABC transporter ATP-binding protein [Pyrinomonadaceae bacterium]